MSSARASGVNRRRRTYGQRCSSSALRSSQVMLRSRSSSSAANRRAMAAKPCRSWLGCSERCDWNRPATSQKLTAIRAVVKCVQSSRIATCKARRSPPFAGASCRNRKRGGTVDDSQTKSIISAKFDIMVKMSRIRADDSCRRRHESSRAAGRPDIGVCVASRKQWGGTVGARMTSSACVRQAPGVASTTCRWHGPRARSPTWSPFMRSRR